LGATSNERKEKKLKLGSLFDGSGGFPVAGALCGIEPIWASEVEPYPIAVTSTRFPNLKHLGDISKINGGEVEPVDIITFGSPCQDLSVAGKRAGLKHEANGDEETTRSGLFMEAVRIIKEMREKTNGKYPRFAVWENVPGAFSSNKGEDFRIVLEELIKVVEPTAVMPEVPQFGWAYADSYCGDGWSLAYRVFDAQYWGVPQRRRRIYLVADFGGQCAREILFEREGLRGYFTEGGTPWKTITSDAERSVGADDREGEIPYTLKIRSGVSVDSYGKSAGKGALIQKNLSATLGVSQDQYLFQPMKDVVTLEPGIASREGGHIYEDVSGTLRANAGDNQMAVAYGISAYESNAMKSSNPHSGIYEAQTSRTIDLNGGNPACNQGGIAIVEGVILDDQGGSQISVRNDGKSPTLRAEMHGNVPCVMESAGFCTEHSAKSRSIGYEKEVSPTLRAGVTPAVVCCLDGDKIGKAERAGGSGLGINDGDKSYTLTAKDVHSVAYGVDCYNQTLTGDKTKTLNSAASDADHVPCAVYSVENHPADSRVNLDESGKVQTLTSRMGTGGGNVPMVMEPFCKEHRAKDKDDATTWKHGKVANTLNTFDQGEVRANELVVEGAPILTANKASFFMNTDENLAGTLVATDYKDPQLVAYSFDPGASRDVGVLFIEECGKTLTNGTCPGHHDGVVIREEEPKFRYIVRRLTPTECARLQGFADRWGDIEEKTDFTDKEYRFWLDVRNTHAAINGKAVKEYNKKQMLTWYNKLHTDSAEYKMWGNGIALPTALYVIQGISEVCNYGS
jgi:DNA (cytosine-5)-methyltransferase 1